MHLCILRTSYAYACTVRGIVLGLSFRPSVLLSMFSATTRNKVAQMQYQWVQYGTGYTCVFQKWRFAYQNTGCLSCVRIRGVPLYKFLLQTCTCIYMYNVCLVCSQQTHFLYMIYMYHKLSRTYMHVQVLYSTSKHIQYMFCSM